MFDLRDDEQRAREQQLHRGRGQAHGRDPADGAVYLRFDDLAPHSWRQELRRLRGEQQQRGRPRDPVAVREFGALNARRNPDQPRRRGDELLPLTPRLHADQVEDQKDHAAEGDEFQDFPRMGWSMKTKLKYRTPHLHFSLHGFFQFSMPIFKFHL